MGREGSGPAAVSGSALPPTHRDARNAPCLFRGCADKLRNMHVSGVQVCACSWGKLHGSLAVAVPADACAVNVSANYKGAFVLVARGGCDFATKAKHMQRAGCATDSHLACQFCHLAQQMG